MTDMDHVIVTIDDTEHPETFCEISIAGQLSLRVSEHEGDRVFNRIAHGVRDANAWIDITGITGERHRYRASLIYGVSTSTKAARHAATLREIQDEDEEKATKRLAGRTFDE